MVSHYLTLPLRELPVAHAAYVLATKDEPARHRVAVRTYHAMNWNARAATLALIGNA